MKLVVTGSLGNISQPLTKILPAYGHRVTEVSSDAKKQATIEALGASAAIGYIAETAVEELLLMPEKITIRYIGSEELTCNEAARIIGTAVGKPWLKWV